MWCMSNSKPTVHSGRVTATCWLTGLRCERRRSHVAGDMLPSLLLAASRATATTQWPSWSAVRRLAAVSGGGGGSSGGVERMRPASHATQPRQLLSARDQPPLLVRFVTQCAPLTNPNALPVLHGHTHTHTHTHLQRAVISAEAAKAVSQHGAGLVRMPQDMVSTLDACFRGVAQLVWGTVLMCSTRVLAR
jgi:hypothetical protein